MTQTQEQRDPGFRERISEEFAAAIEAGTAPWQRPGAAHGYGPFNPATGKRFRGVNDLILSLHGSGQSDPRWMTSKQAADLGGRPAPGAEPVTLEFWDRNGAQPKAFYAKMFNGSQIEGLEPFAAETPAIAVSIDETLLLAAGRLLSLRPGPLSAQSAARDYLRVEIAGFMLARDYNLSRTPDPQAAFMAADLLRDNGNELFVAARDAELIRTWVIDPSQRPALEQAAETRREAAQRRREETQTPKVYLAVPYDDKDKAKSLGARWDKEAQSWYVPEGADQAAFAAWTRGAAPMPKEKEQQAVTPHAYLNVPYDDKDKVKALGAKWDKEAQSWYVPEGADPAAFAAWKAEKPQAAAAIAPDAPKKEEQAVRPQVYLNVPYDEKDKAKALGAKWDKTAKSWYVPEGADLAAFSAWKIEKPQAAASLSPQEEFVQACRDHGLDVERPLMDGKWHRVALIDDKGKSPTLNGSYIGFLDGRPAGQITNFKAGGTVKWVAAGQTLTPEARQALAAEAAQARGDRQAAWLEAVRTIARKAYGVWANVDKPGQGQDRPCPYLDAKGVQAHGAKIDDKGRLIVPARDADGKLWSLQFVDKDEKRFLAHGRKAATMHVIAPGGKHALTDVTPEMGPILIAEGYATAATLFEATGRPTVAAFDSGNLEAVAQAVRDKHPDQAIVICADDDHAAKVNVGLDKAREAAGAVKAAVVSPPFSNQEKQQGMTDFNDLAAARGKDAVRLTIDVVLAQNRFLARENNREQGRAVA